MKRPSRAGFGCVTVATINRITFEKDDQFNECSFPCQPITINVRGLYTLTRDSYVGNLSIRTSVHGLPDFLIFSLRRGKTLESRFLYIRGL
jgi:hypothetical protein